jgi:methylmalonyl-CoA/ethylmalonyl-CoA epimerase
MGMNVGQIRLAVVDLKLEIEFYRDRLGLRLIFESPNTAFFDCGVRLELCRVEAGRVPSNSLIYFTVPDLEAAVEALKSQGVAFDRDAHLVAHLPEHNLFMAFLHDPEQNPIGLRCERRHTCYSSR